LEKCVLIPVRNEGIEAVLQVKLLTMCNVVDTVQVFFSFLIKHVLALSTHYLQRVLGKENFAGRPEKKKKKYYKITPF